MSTDRVRAVQDRRRSNAAGPHGGQPTRAEEIAAALADYEDEAELDGQNDESEARA